jgi:predicted AlkP superfamily phosphohydrolase/phosphomutase
LAEPTVLAIGLDAADPLFIRRMIDGGELPALAELERQGSMERLRAPSQLSSGSVWPTFLTGSQPHEHGVFSGGWAWDPEAMQYGLLDTERLRPFWEQAERSGLRVGVVDVPFAPLVGLQRGFEVHEWGSHDAVAGRTSVSPAHVRDELTEQHPFSSSRLRPAGPYDRVEPSLLVSGCVEGAARRGRLAERLITKTGPDLAVVIFEEIHHAAHDLWHTAEPDHLLYEDLPSSNGHGIADLYREVDRGVGRLTELVGDDAVIVVFGLHGMRPSRGVVSLLAPVLTEMGYTRPAAGTGGSRANAGRNVLAWTKRRTPASLKRLYHARAPLEFRRRAAVPTLLAPLDWTRTAAFSLPTDQHGWLRINLRGREAEGIVAPSGYAPLRDEIAERLLALTRDDGEPLVKDVERWGTDDAPPALLPDLVVHWTEAAMARPVRVRGMEVEVEPLGPALTGQHRDEGFFLARGLEPESGGGIDAADLGDLLVDAAGRHR